MELYSKEYRGSNSTQFPLVGTGEEYQNLAFYFDQLSLAHPDTTMQNGECGKDPITSG